MEDGKVEILPALREDRNAWGPDQYASEIRKTLVGSFLRTARLMKELKERYYAEVPSETWTEWCRSKVDMDIREASKLIAIGSKVLPLFELEEEVLNDLGRKKVEMLSELPDSEIKETANKIAELTIPRAAKVVREAKGGEPGGPSSLRFSVKKVKRLSTELSCLLSMILPSPDSPPGERTDIVDEMREDLSKLQDIIGKVL